ncbi:MAG TPA: hypothetical protein VLQ45_07745 [Thermoanaerobaculia bacterium]|nr:hypothetical protein [Thermoanaerobaculia bacterium]
MAHLSDAEIERYLTGWLDAGQFEEAVRHLLTGCTECGDRIARHARTLLSREDGPEEAEFPEAGYDEALDRAKRSVPRLEAAAERDLKKLSRSLDLLTTKDPGRLTSRQVSSLYGWPLCEALLRKSFEERYRDPRRMLELAHWARVVAEQTPLDSRAPEFVYDLRARAWAELANAHRINEGFREAENALARAYSLLSKGTGDLLLLARVTDLEASLRSSQRRLDEGLGLLDQVYRLYLEAGDRHLAGRALISRGINLHYRGDAGAAVDLLREGLALIDPGRDRQLTAIGQEGLLHALVDCGKYREAGELLLQSGLRQAFAGEPLNLLKLRGVEAKILAGRGKLGRAGRALEEVRAELTRVGQDYDAALVGLDLAAVWLRMGKAADVRELAGEMLETFRFLEVHTQAEIALCFLHEACRMAVASPRTVDAVRTFLTRLQREPWLRFDPEMAV